MNNIYSCRKIERQVQRDIHYIWLVAQERPDFVTINRFRNRVKKEINNIFTQVVLLLAERGFITLDVEYIDGTKIESKANKYTFVWRKTEEKNLAKLQDKIRVPLQQIDDVIAQDKAAEAETVEFTSKALDSLIGELKDALSTELEPVDKEMKKQRPRYRPNPFHHDNFHYNTEEDYYVCQMGLQAHRHRPLKDRKRLPQRKRSILRSKLQRLPFAVSVQQGQGRPTHDRG